MACVCHPYYQELNVRSLHISRDNKKIGEFSEGQVLGLLQSGWLFDTDQVWNGESCLWEPLSEKVGQLQANPMNAEPLPVIPLEMVDYQPTVHKAISEAAPVPAPEPEDFKPLPWRNALVCTVIVNIYGIVLSLDTLRNGANVEQVISGWRLFGGYLLIAILYILSIFLSYDLHYRCWRALPPRHRRLLPEEAVGNIFVLGLNFYWYFKTFIYLAQDYQAWSREAGYKEPANLVLRGICLALVWDMSWVITFVSQSSLMRPVLSMVFMPLLLVLNIWFYAPIVRQAHAIHGRQAVQER